MASPLVEFCEQANPAVLSEARRAKFQAANRVQRSLLARAEKRALVWLAERTPPAVNPDHLTVLGLSAQVMAGVSYVLARGNHYWLLAGIGFLALNWLGDSLDGTLARVRQRQRPRYGFYVDHIIDSFGALALMSGLGLSGYMHPYIATGLLVAFLLLSVQSYLAAYTLSEFRLSFWSFGPTELRILLAAGNLALMRWPVVLKEQYRLFDVGGAIGLSGMSLMLIFIYRAQYPPAVLRGAAAVSGVENGWQTLGKRWLKFNAVGGIGIGVQLVVLATLKSGLHLNYLVATGLAVEAAVIHNFVWHQRYTWADRSGGRSLLRLAKFNLTTGAFSILGNLAAMKLLVGVAGLPYLPANGITIVACSVVNFLVSDGFVFSSS